jgi:YesN/AraC family two-component response regulator
MFIQEKLPFDIGYRENEKHWLVENHYHNDYEIIYVSKGSPEFSINEKVYKVTQDSLIFINNLEPHEYTILEYPYSRYVIMLKPNFINTFIDEPMLTSVFKHRPKDFIHVLKLTTEQAPEIHSIFERIIFEYSCKNPFLENTVKLYIYLLLVSVFRISNKLFPLSSMEVTANKKIIVDIQKYIEDNYTEEISLKDISKRFHTDMYYLCHLFKEVTGYTFKSYLTLRRISSAKDLLSYSDKDVTEVGLDSGFSNVNHFIRTFKKIVGVTPFQYKKKNAIIKER